MEITDARKLTRDAQEALRKRIVRAVFNGMSQTQACKVFGVSRTAIYKWIKQYNQKGLQSLNKKTQGRPKQSGKLKGWQAAYVVRAITDKSPEQFKMSFVLWSRAAIKELIQTKFEMKLSISSVSRLLKKWNFTAQKPIKRAYERNPILIKKWMSEEYPKIKALAKKENAQIHWCDETGIRSTDQVGRSFGRKGKTPVVINIGKRFKCNMISSITNQGNCRFMVFKDDFKIDVFVKFLRKLIYKAPKKIFIITDNHRVHRAKKVIAWIKKHSDKIAIYYLPPYAPELNPDELLNQDLKANIFKHKRAKNVDQLKKLTRSYVNKIQKMPHKIINFFDKKELAYIKNINTVKC